MQKTMALFFIWIFGLSTLQAQRIQAQDFQDVVSRMRDSLQVKGISVGVWVQGEGIWQGCAGISHDTVGIKPDMLFGIASNSKLFTAVSILRLKEEGLLQLDDSIFRFVTPFQHIDSNITIRQLLNHTAGLRDVTEIPNYSLMILNDASRIYRPEEILSLIGSPLYAPGKGWNYSNTHYILLGLIAEKAAGKPFNQILAEQILDRLNLEQTFLPPFDTIVGTIAQPWHNGANIQAFPREALNSAAWSAGAMYANTDNLIHWLKALYHDNLISADSKKEMTTFVGSGKYGFGISENRMNNQKVWMHGGEILGYRSQAVYDPNLKALIVVLINQFPAEPFVISSALHRLLLQPLSFATAKSMKFNLYPNPNNGYYLIIETDYAPFEVKLVDAFGKQMLSRKLTSQYNKIELPELAKGVYYLHAPNGVEKLIVNNR